MRNGCCAGFLAAAAMSLLPAHLIAQGPWMELRREGFVLRGQLSADALAAVACDVETAVKALRGTAVDGNAPMVVAVDNGRGIREWLPQFNERGRGNPLGAYWRGLYGDHIVIRIDAPPAERLRRILHEYAHYATHLTHPEPAPWLDEGISEVWEHAGISRDAIEIGQPIADHLKPLRAGKNWIPVQELISANAIPARASAMFYAESWALAHYLLFEKYGGKAILDRLPAPANIPTDEALKAYVAGPLAEAVRISTAAASGGCQGPAVTSEVPPLDAMLARARALADGERPAAAVPLLQAALALNKGNAEATETLGFVYFRENRAVEAAALFDRVIAAQNPSHVSFYYRAVLAGPVPELSGGGGLIPQVDYLRKALALNPGFAPAVQRLNELIRKEQYLAPKPGTVRQ